MNENIRLAIRRRDESVSFAAAEGFDSASYQRVSHGTIRAVEYMRRHDSHQSHCYSLGSYIICQKRPESIYIQRRPLPSV